jgi:hypothetical protein
MASGSSSSIRNCSTDADTLNGPDFWQPGVFHSEHLVNMSHHNYREEPNVRFSPDKKLVIFTSNMFGPSYVFGAEVGKGRQSPTRRRRLHTRTRRSGSTPPTHPTAKA